MMNSRYEHNLYEKRIYSLWEKSGGFSPTDDPKAEPFCIIMPPPNANDPLHVGHAMFVAIEDILTRYHRMKGDATLWLPGTDHAGIETQFVFEKKLKKAGKSRFDFDRETLYQMIWDYVQENSGVAVDQMKKLGASADWSRFKFTLDKDVVAQVVATFKKMHEDGLVYRDVKLVNYCTSCGTGFSELEVKHIERQTPLYYMKYGPFTLATVRPETKFGDTAVAVNPNDKRYKKWIGKEVEVEGLLGKFKIKVIGDSYVDSEFGTGVLKVTPAHDPNDFAMWQRHKNEIPGPKQVIGFDGKLNDLTGRYAGLRVQNAREIIVKDLQEAGFLEKIDEKYTHNVGTCYRCGTVLEPLPAPQFWVKVKPLTTKVLKSLKEKRVKVMGAGHDKILKNWLNNLQDWNISRQIVWGIRIPVWYCGKWNQTPPLGTHYIVAEEKPARCDMCGVTEFTQDTDSFDTWFSSGQWPYVTLLAQRTNEKLKVKNEKLQDDFERFYPTQVMETAYDILMMWVMRMLMMGLYLTGKVPFERVYLHGLIRDAKGQKMSKSKGNVINPLTVVEQYGADALRMALVIRSTPGLDKGVGDGDFRAMRNLTNKIWNAARYVIMAAEKRIPTGEKDEELRENLDGSIKTMTKRLEDLRVGQAADWIYDWFWHVFCDKYIEFSKQGLISTDLLIEGFVTNLKLLHPFVPFVTEAVYQELGTVGLAPKGEPLLLTSMWPLLKQKEMKG